MRKLLLFASILIALRSVTASAAPEPRKLDPCSPLPKAIKVVSSSAACGRKPTVSLSGSWKNSFSAAFRWDDGSREGQDRSPFALDDSSASSSPYKTQRRIRGKQVDLLCFGKFLNRRGYPTPEQLTVKRTAAPSVKRFCVTFR